MKPFNHERDYQLRNFSTFSKEELSPSNRGQGHMRGNSMNTGFNERSQSKERYSPKATNVSSSLPSRFRNDRELVELFEECEGQILFWKSRYERLIEENIQLKESILETTNELEDLKRTAGGPGRNQYIESENKSLLDKIRIQTTQLQNAFQDNENLRQRLIDKSRDMEKMRNDYENRLSDLEVKTRREVDNPNLKSRLSALEFELEEETRKSFDLKKNFEKKENEYQRQIRDLNRELDQVKRKLFSDADILPTSPARGHLRQNSYSHQGRTQSPSGHVDRLVRQLRRDLSMHDFNLERLNEILMNLERVKFSNNTPLIRDLVESLSQMKQQFIDSRDARQDSVDSLVGILQSGELSIGKSYEFRHPMGRGNMEADSLRAEIQDKDEKIRSLESHLSSLREQNSYLESELNVKQDLIQELRKRIEYNEENMRVMSEEYKNHLKSAYELQYQSIDFSNDEIIKLKEHITELRDQNFRLQNELNEKEVALNNFRQRNKKLLEHLNFQETEKMGGAARSISDSQFFRGEYGVEEPHPLNDQEKYFRLKERREQLDFLVKIGLRLNPAYFNEIKPHYDNLKFNNVTNIVKFNELINKAENKLIEEVDHISLSADSSTKQMQMTIKSLREELMAKNHYMEGVKKNRGIDEYVHDLSPEEIENEIKLYRNMPANEGIKSLVKENLALRRIIQESEGKDDEFGRRENPNHNYLNQMDLQSTQRHTRYNDEQYGGNPSGPSGTVTPFEPGPEQVKRQANQAPGEGSGFRGMRAKQGYGDSGTQERLGPNQNQGYALNQGFGNQGYGQDFNQGLGQPTNQGLGQSSTPGQTQGIGQNLNQGYGQQGFGQNSNQGGLNPTSSYAAGQNQAVRAQDMKSPGGSAASNEETMKRLVREMVNFPAVGNFKITVLKAKNILGVEKKGTLSNAYCRLVLGKEKKNTKIIDSLNPEWNQTFVFPINIADASKIPVIHVEVMDNDIIGDEFLGDCVVDLSESLIHPGLSIDLEKKLENLSKKKTKGTITGSVFLKLVYEPSNPSQAKTAKPQADTKTQGDIPSFGVQGGKSVSGGSSGQLPQNSQVNQNTMGDLMSGGHLSKQNSSGGTSGNPQNLMSPNNFNPGQSMGGSAGGMSSTNYMGSEVKQGNYMNSGSGVKGSNLSAPGEYMMGNTSDSMKSSQKMNLLKQNEAMLETQKLKNNSMPGGGLPASEHMVDSFGHQKAFSGNENYTGGAPNFGGSFNPNSYQGQHSKESEEESVFKNTPAKKNMRKEMMFVKN